MEMAFSSKIPAKVASDSRFLLHRSPMAAGSISQNGPIKVESLIIKSQRLWYYSTLAASSKAEEVASFRPQGQHVLRDAGGLS